MPSELEQRAVHSRTGTDDDVEAKSMRGPPTALEALVDFVRNRSHGESVYRDLERATNEVDGPWKDAEAAAAAAPEVDTAALSSVELAPLATQDVNDDDGDDIVLKRAPHKKRRPLLSSLLYFAGSIVYLIACVILLPFLALDPYASDLLFVMGSVAFVTAATVDVVDAHERKVANASTVSLPCHRFAQSTEALVQNYLYLIGAALFLFGSVLYMPQMGLKTTYGTYVFRVGSSTYLVASAYGLALQMYPHGHEVARNLLAVSTCVQYMLGSALFLVGGELFLKTNLVLGAWIWVVGSVLFTTGSLTAVLLAWTNLASLSGTSSLSTPSKSRAHSAMSGANL